MTKQKLSAILIILALIISNVFFVYKSMQAEKEVARLNADLVAIEAKIPVIEFNQLFVDKVLRAEGEIGYETRFELETKARSLKDNEVLDQWNRFVNADTEQDAQTEVKKLLGLLAQRMRS